MVRTSILLIENKYFGMMLSLLCMWLLDCLCKTVYIVTCAGVEVRSQ